MNTFQFLLSIFAWTVSPVPGADATQPSVFILWQPVELCHTYFHSAKFFIASIPPPFEQSSRAMKRTQQVTRDLCGTITSFETLWNSVPESVGHPEGYSFADHEVDFLEVRRLCRDIERSMETTVNLYDKQTKHLARLDAQSLERGVMRGFFRFQDKLGKLDQDLQDMLMMQYHQETWVPDGEQYLSGEEMREQMEVAQKVYNLLTSQPGWTAQTEAAQITHPFKQITRDHQKLSDDLDTLIGIANEILAADATRSLYVEGEAPHPEIDASHSKQMKRLSLIVFGDDFAELRQMMAFMMKSSLKLVQAEGRLSAKQDKVSTSLKTMLLTDEWNNWKTYGTPLKGRWTDSP